MRCKFRLNSISRQIHSLWDGKQSVPTEVHSLELAPVYSGDPNSENARFWAATPSGSFTLGCVNAAAVAGLKLGGEYYIDITPAE